jgi:predicted transcriptional regulator
MSVLKFGKTIPQFTRNLRREKQWTQLELATQMGVHPQYVSNVEREKMSTYMSFGYLLLSVCPQDRRKYLQDLIQDSAMNHVVRRLDAKAKAAKAKRRA